MAMTIDELIAKTKKESLQIKKHFEILYNFQCTNPWIINSVLDELKEQGKTKIPTFEEVVGWKEEYFINDYSKIYHQIKEHNPDLISTGDPQLIYFYILKKDMYKKQRVKGLSIGDRDQEGRLVTGSDLIIDITGVDLKTFLNFYFIASN